MLYILAFGALILVILALLCPQISFLGKTLWEKWRIAWFTRYQIIGEDVPLGNCS